MQPRVSNPACLNPCWADERMLTGRIGIQWSDLADPDQGTHHCHRRVSARPVDNCYCSRSNWRLHTVPGEGSRSASTVV